MSGVTLESSTGESSAGSHVKEFIDATTIFNGWETSILTFRHAPCVKQLACDATGAPVLWAPIVMRLTVAVSLTKLGWIALRPL